MTATLAAALPDAGKDSLPSLDDMPQWIARNIRFPVEACRCGVAGVERFVVSAAWDGRVFITSRLDALHPCYEEAVKEVVARAPRCGFASASAADVYKLVEVDFSALVPDSLREGIVNVGRHLGPKFVRGSLNAHPLADNRALFVGWLSEKYRLPAGKELKNYADTVSLTYTVTGNGSVPKVRVADCKNDEIRRSLLRAADKSPRWRPAVAEKGDTLSIVICERIILSTDPAGDKIPLRILPDAVCRNADTSPTDPETIVPNPTEKARYAGDDRSIFASIRRSLHPENRVAYAVRFIVERDGTVSDVAVRTTDSEADSVIRRTIARSAWIPARQGGVAVRSLCSFVGEAIPPGRRVYAPADHYPDFLTGGKRPAFVYDASCGRGLQRRWKRFCAAYPGAEAAVYGPGEFRSLDNASYAEALIVRGLSIPSTRTMRSKR